MVRLFQPLFIGLGLTHTERGVIPIHLMELSPGSFRTFVVGTTYQLGNLISSASSTIEARIGERYPLPPKGNTKRYQYGLVICIFMACGESFSNPHVGIQQLTRSIVYTYVIILTFLGPEYLGRKFGVAYDNDMTDAAGREAMAAAHVGGEYHRDQDSSDDGHGVEKGHARPVEKV